jgi:DNA-binding transcriptional LysR family regulator
MNLVDLALLLDVARLGSFAAVARLRGLDPSSVGRLVSAIETELGVRLFERTTRRMQLTEAGDLYLSRIAPTLEELDRAREEALALSAEPRGSLRLSASVTFGQRVIVPRLAHFRARHPAVRVEAVFTDANVDLVAERIDLAVRLGPAVDGDVIVTKLMDTRYLVVAAPGYLSAAPPLDAPSGLAAHRALLFPFRGFRTRWLFRDRNGAVTEQAVDGDVILSPASALRDATVAGLGPALLPDWLVAEDLAAGRLQHCLANWDATATTFGTAAWLIYPSRSYLPAKTRAMVDFLKSSVTSAP